MAAQVNRLAQALRAGGMRPGRVANLTPSNAELLMAHFALPLAGGVLVTLNTRVAPAEIVRIIEQSGAEILIGGATLLEQALTDLSAAGLLRGIVIRDELNIRGHRQPPAGGTPRREPAAAVATRRMSSFEYERLARPA